MGRRRGRRGRRRRWRWGCQRRRRSYALQMRHQMFLLRSRCLQLASPSRLRRTVPKIKVFKVKCRVRLAYDVIEHHPPRADAFIAGAEIAAVAMNVLLEGDRLSARVAHDRHLFFAVPFVLWAHISTCIGRRGKRWRRKRGWKRKLGEGCR